MKRPHIFREKGGWYVRWGDGKINGPVFDFLLLCWGIRASERSQKLREIRREAERLRTYSDVNPRAG